MRTMQTEAPLPRLPLSTHAYTLDTILSWASDGGAGLDMDQPYQRGDVWGLTRRRNLIRSLLMGVPIPSIIVNARFDAGFTESSYDDPRLWAYAVVDGKQRATTILRFLASEFAVPASWFPPDRVRVTEETPDGPYVRFSGLTLPAQRFLRHRPIAVAQGQMRTLDEEREIFDLVNYGGVPQGEADADA